MLRNGAGVEEMAQCMAHLAHKPEGGSSDLQDPGKSCPVVAATGSSSPQEAETGQGKLVI